MREKREKGRDINLRFTILCVSAFAGLDAFYLYEGEESERERKEK